MRSSSNTLQAPQLLISKGASPTTRTIGETVTYTLDVTVPANVILNDVTVIDTRNDYEVALGTFANARDPATSALHADAADTLEVTLADLRDHE